MRRILVAVLGLALAAGACSLAPKYSRPEMPVASEWEAPPGGTGSPEAPPAAEIHWREFFADASLRSVIELALANNRDLRLAALAVDKARAAYRIQGSDLYPDVGVAGYGEVYRLPEKMSEDGTAQTVEQYSVNLGLASWELDFFGRIRSLKDSALEQYLATEEAGTAAQISMIAAVASTYLALAADRESLDLAEETLAAQQASYELIRRSSELGMASDLDLYQSRSQVDASRAEVARLTGLVAMDRNALALLAGAPISASLMPGALSAVTEMTNLAPGLPSDVLLRRPDILAAEHRLRSANANIGAARAAFFPRLSLTAGVGTMSSDLSSLFKDGSGTWTFAPQVIVPIFTAGTLRANLEVTRIDREMAVAEYEKVIQTAFREVNDALSLRQTLADQVEAQQSLVASLEDAYRLSEIRYQNGIESYLAVLVAERSLYSARRGLVGTRLAEQANLVELFKVLGGGGSGANFPDPGASTAAGGEAPGTERAPAPAGGAEARGEGEPVAADHPGAGQRGPAVSG